VFSLGSLTLALSRADSRSEARAKAVGVGSSAWLGGGVMLAYRFVLYTVPFAT